MRRSALSLVVKKIGICSGGGGTGGSSRSWLERSSFFIFWCQSFSVFWKTSQKALELEAVLAHFAGRLDLTARAQS
jgi:hypothetical protein